MILVTPVRLALMAAMALIGLGVLGGGALGQVASPVARTPVAGAEAAILSAADQAYLDAMNPIVTNVQDSLVRYAALAGDPQLDELDWLEKFAFELMRWRSAYRDAFALEPPPSFAESHGRYLEALGLLAETSDTANAAVNDGDLAGLLQAGARIMLATRLLDQATVLMEGVTGEPGGVRPVASPAGATPVAGLAASAAGLAETAWDAASSTPAAGGEGPGQVNVMVEVNTYVGLGDLSTGEHTFQFTKVGECAGAGDEP